MAGIVREIFPDVVLTRCTDSFIVGLTVSLLGEYIETYHSSELGLTVRLLGLSAFDWKAELTHRPCAVAGKLFAIDIDATASDIPASDATLDVHHQFGRLRRRIPRGFASFRGAHRGLSAQGAGLHATVLGQKISRRELERHTWCPTIAKVLSCQERDADCSLIAETTW